jgi:Uma2 family endonuclease
MSPTAPVPATYRVTFEDWLRYPDDGKLYEILEGELAVSPPPTFRHQRIGRKLLRALDTYFEERASGEVFYAPVGVRLSEDTVLEPDLVGILREHLDRIVEERYLDGAPDLVVEILSPGTAGRDLGAKRALYEHAGVPEYWIVDPIAATILVLTLRASAYREAGLYRRDQTLLSPLLAGLEIPLSKVF